MSAVLISRYWQGHGAAGLVSSRGRGRVGAARGEQVRDTHPRFKES